MANHPSSEKRNRQRITRTVRNKAAKSAVRTLVKNVRAALESGDATSAQSALKAATSALDGAVSKGVMHRRTASRSVSRLTTAVQAVKSAK